MIYDHISNFNKYVCVHPHFKDAHNFILTNNLSALMPGKIEINQHGAYASISKYYPKIQKDGILGCHKKYIDIQILLEGIEQIGVCNKIGCTEFEYNKETDFQKLDGDVSYIKMDNKYFAVFFPQDAHMPQIQYKKNKNEIKKIVFKIQVL